MRVKTPRIAPWMLVAALLTTLPALSACFKLSRNAPPTLRYTLTVPPAASRVATNGMTVGMRRLELASYLATPTIVVRRSEHEIITSEFHRWGERLDEGINRVVAAHLAAQPAIRAVDVAPWGPRAMHDVTVQLHVERFEGVTAAGGGSARVHMQISWDIVRPLDGRVLVRGSSAERDATWQEGNYDSLVRGLDASLVRVAQDISGCLAGFRNDSTPPASCAVTAGSARPR
jgi:uncharacterized lipoprotein YmbA